MRKGHTRVVWVSYAPEPTTDDETQQKALASCIAAIGDAAMAGNQRRVGKEHWRSVFCDPHSTDQVQETLKEYGFTVHDVSIEGTPYSERSQ